MRIVIFIVLALLLCGCQSKTKQVVNGNNEKTVEIWAGLGGYHEVRIITINGYEYVVVTGTESCAICPALGQDKQPKTSVKE